MFKTYFYIVFLFASANLSCQSFNFKIQNDSISTLRQFYKKTKDTLFYKKAIQLAKETQNDSIIRETYILFGIQSYFNKDLKTLYKIKNNLYRIFKENNDSLALAKHYHYKALYFREKKIIDSSFFYYNKSKDISNQENDSLEVARRLLSMSTMQYSERDYLGCENSIIKGLRYIEPLNEIKYTSILYEKLGVVLRITDRFDEARESFRKAFRIKNQKGDVRIDEHAILYNHIAKSYEAQGNNKKAIEFYKKSLSTDDSLFFKYPKRYRTSLEGLSYNNFILGNKKLALKGYLEVLALREKINDKNGLVFSHSLLGEIYASNKQTKKAICLISKTTYSTAKN